MICAGAQATKPATGPLRLVDAPTHVMVENLKPADEFARLRKAGIARMVLMHVDLAELQSLAAANPDFGMPSLGVARTTVATARTALAPLPEAQRNAIAHRNTERLYSGCAAG